MGPLAEQLLPHPLLMQLSSLSIVFILGGSVLGPASLNTVLWTSCCQFTKKCTMEAGWSWFNFNIAFNPFGSVCLDFKSEDCGMGCHGLSTAAVHLSHQSLLIHQEREQRRLNGIPLEHVNKVNNIFTYPLFENDTGSVDKVSCRWSTMTLLLLHVWLLFTGQSLLLE